MNKINAFLEFLAIFAVVVAIIVAAVAYVAAAVYVYDHYSHLWMIPMLVGPFALGASIMIWWDYR